MRFILNSVRSRVSLSATSKTASQANKKLKKITGALGVVTKKRK